MPYLRAMSTFRDDIRLAAMKPDTSLKKILVLCDELRDEALVPLGVALDDQEGMLACYATSSKSLIQLARWKGIDQICFSGATYQSAKREKGAN